VKNSFLFLIAGTLGFAGPAIAADTAVVERKKIPIEIQAEEQRRMEEMKEIKPVAEIREEETGIPEIPKPVSREDLSPAERMRLDELEHKRAAGKITETEYQLEKDSLFRDANIKF
jgi:hypothetical protein